MSANLYQTTSVSSQITVSFIVSCEVLKPHICVGINKNYIQRIKIVLGKKLFNEKQNLIISNILPYTPDGIWKVNCISPQEITAHKCYLKKEVHDIKAEARLEYVVRCCYAMNGAPKIRSSINGVLTTFALYYKTSSIEHKRKLASNIISDIEDYQKKWLEYTGLLSKGK
jgi:hypothetical protein